MDSSRLRNELQEAFRQLFVRHQYEIMVTLRFEHQSIRGKNVHKYLGEFTRNVAKSRKTQVAGHGVFNCLNHPHAHLLLFGKSTTLGNVTNSEAEAFWPYGSAHVSRVEDEGAAQYSAINITPHAQDLYDVIPFNVRLLNKFNNQNVENNMYH